MKRILLLLCLIAFNGGLIAQTISSSAGGGVYINFQTLQSLSAGATATGHYQIGFNVPKDLNLPNWKLTAQITSPIIINGTALDPQYISLQLNPDLVPQYRKIANAIQAPTSYIPLNFQEVTLIESSQYSLKAPPDTYFELKYNLKIAGGPHLMELQNGSYPINIKFSLFNSSGALISSSNTSSTFGKYFQDPNDPSGPNAYRTITLVNGAQDVSLNFVSDADYQNGVSVSITDGLRVQGQAPYQIRVKSNTPNFTSNQTSIIPVSVVSLQSSAGTKAPVAATYNTITLSGVPQFQLRKTSWTDPNPVYYNLRYSTSPNDTNLRSAGSGSYSTILTFSIESN